MQHSCLPEFTSSQHFLRIVVDAKASGPPHILELWFGVIMGMLSVKYFRSKQIIVLCLSIFLLTKSFHNTEVNLTTLSFWGYYGFKTVVSACLSVFSKLKCHSNHHLYKCLYSLFFSTNSFCLSTVSASAV